MKLSSILGLNARAQLFSYRYNGKEAKKIASSKLRTKRVLKRGGIPVPELYAKFKNPRDVLEFNWENLPSSFVLKPSKGFGGDGIIVLKKKAFEQIKSSSKNGKFLGWISSQRNLVTIEDLKLHALDILEGAYSMGNVPDVAFCEEFVGRHKLLRKYAYRGTPDIRVVVFNKVPVLAMLRLPTRESKGRANIHQGAICVGIDIATGITTRAMHNNKFIKYKPVYFDRRDKQGSERSSGSYTNSDTIAKKKKLNGIKIPHWNKVLELAVQAQIVSGIGYLGADIILHPEKGPMVLELNSQPGLQIQLVNMVGLRRRLEKVEDLDTRDAEHGVRVAKALFANRFLDRVKAEEGIKIIKSTEEVNILAQNGEKVPVIARVDTGALNSSIDTKFAETLGLYNKDRILWYKRIHSALGKDQRPVIPVTFWVAGRKLRTVATVAQRRGLPHKMIIGRNDVKGFLINPDDTEEKS